MQKKPIVMLTHTNIKLFALMLRSGISPVEAFEYLLNSLKKNQIEAGRVLLVEISAGLKFSRILAKTSLGKSRLYIHMLESAEVSGNIPEALEKISQNIEELLVRRGQVISVLIYPAIVLSMATLLILGLLLFIIPNIMPIIHMNSKNVSLVTQALIFCSKALRVHGLVISVIFIACVICAASLVRIKSVRKISEKIAFKIPFVNSFVESYISSGYALALYQYTSMTPDLPLVFARLADGTKSIVFKKEFSRVEKSISEGFSLSHTFSTSLCIKPIWVLFAKVAEQTSSYALMFRHLYEYYRQVFEHKSKLLIKFVEPTLMIFIGVVVGVLAYGILSPLYGLMNNLK